MLIDLQINKIAAVMSFDKKDIFHRLAKILEEQGELAEALILNDHSEIIEESIDNLMVLTSIAYVVDDNAMILAQKIVNDVFCNHTYGSNNINSLWMNYNVDIGKMSNAVQKNQRIGASSYKGFATSEEVVSLVMVAISHLTAFISLHTQDIDLLNAIIVKKNAKWHQKTVEGQTTKAA